MLQGKRFVSSTSYLELIKTLEIIRTRKNHLITLPLVFVLVVAIVTAAQHRAEYSPLRAGMNALPTCTFNGPVNAASQTLSTITATCGRIYIPNAGGFPYIISSTINVPSNAIEFVGMGGSAPVQISCTTSPCFKVNNPSDNGAEMNYGEMFQNISLIGNGSANQVGVLVLDTAGVRFRNFHAEGFTGANATAIEFEADNAGTGTDEREGGYNLMLENNTCGITYSGVASNTDFGHQHWYGLYASMWNGQSMFCMNSNSQVYSSAFDGVCNAGDANSGHTMYCVKFLSSTNAFIKSFMDIARDNGGNGTLAWCSGCTGANTSLYGAALGNDSDLDLQDSAINLASSTASATNGINFSSGTPGNTTFKAGLFLDSSNDLGLTPDGSHEPLTIIPSTGLIETNGGVSFVEGTPTGSQLGQDVCAGNSMLHTLECSYNGGAFQPLENGGTLTAGVCTTGSTAYSTCSNTVSFFRAEPDTNYAVSCSGIGASGFPVIQSLGVKTTAGITVTIMNESGPDALASSFSEIDCTVTR